MRRLVGFGYLGGACLLVLTGCGVSDMEKRQTLIMGYVISHQMLDVMNQTECAPLFPTPPGPEAVRRAVIPYLKESEVRVVFQPLEGQRRFKKSVDTALSLNPSDNRRVCERIFRQMNPKIEAAIANWENGKNSLPRYDTKRS